MPAGAGGPLEPGEERGLGTASAPDVTVRPAAELRAEFDALVLAGGATLPRDLTVPGRALAGVHFALEYLKPSNLVREGALTASPISARGKRVVIIGGGDTGADCLGTAHRQGAASVHQFEILAEPPEPFRRAPVAAVAAHPADVVGPRGGRRACVLRHHDRARRRRHRSGARPARS